MKFQAGKTTKPEEEKTVKFHVSLGGGASGPAAAKRGPRQRPRAMGQGEQDRRGAARRHGHIDPPHPGSAILCPLFKHPQSPRMLGVTLIQAQGTFVQTNEDCYSSTCLDWDVREGKLRLERDALSVQGELRQTEEPACSSS